MDPDDATQGTSRDLRASQIETFLKVAFAGGEKAVVALQEKARAAGLLGERQTITDSKSFRSAKAVLRVRSHRVGFGRGAIWFWVLPALPASEPTTRVTLPVDVYEFAPSDRAPETSPCYAQSMCGRLHGALLEWTRAVEILQLRPRPSGIPGHRWALFMDDSSGSMAPRGRSAPPNSAGILPNYSAANTRPLTNTSEARACYGIKPVDRSCKSLLTGPTSLTPMEGRDGFIGAQFR
jgi:hypothetical protein